MHKCSPVVRSKFFSAIHALDIFLDILNNLSDLYFHGLVDIPVVNYFEFEPFRVRFGPHKVGRLNIDFVCPFCFFKENGHHFLTLPIAIDPRRSLITIAISTIVYIISF